MSEKSIVVFTNFWDADTIIEARSFLVSDAKKEKAYKINLLKDATGDPMNYSVHSIALSHPDFDKKPNLKSIARIDCFCPTYDLLKRYKENKDWAAYHKDFVNLIKKRKKAMTDWMESLVPDRVYFLCCWENTSNGAHCHRDILYKAFANSQVMSQKIIPVYRSGGYSKKGQDNRRMGDVEMTSTQNAAENFLFNSILSSVQEFAGTIEYTMPIDESYEGIASFDRATRDLPRNVIVRDPRPQPTPRPRRTPTASSLFDEFPAFSESDPRY